LFNQLNPNLIFYKLEPVITASAKDFE
jgi:hypothetical protein